MSGMKIALLPDRGVVSVTGADAEKLLQGVITNDVGLLASQPAIHAGLLSPQGKILFEFFVVKAADGFCLETARDRAAALAERLTMYRLRADAEVRDRSSDYTVAAIWGGAPEPHGGGSLPLSFPDPRLSGMGRRELVTMRTDWALGAEDAASATQEEYHAHRIGLGVPEGGKDYVLGDTFPHEALFDKLNGVSFTKGCYVGQEVVSRMENRGTARKRVVPVAGDAPLPASGTAIVAGNIELGRLGSVAGSRGLALLRLDRVAEVTARGEQLSAATVGLHVELPDWLESAAPVGASSPAP